MATAREGGVVLGRTEESIVRRSCHLKRRGASWLAADLRSENLFSRAYPQSGPSGLPEALLNPVSAADTGRAAPGQKINFRP